MKHPTIPIIIIFGRDVKNPWEIRLLEPDFITFSSELYIYIIKELHEYIEFIISSYPTELFI